MPLAHAAVRTAERALRDLQLAWNSAEGRRGHIAEQRRALAEQTTELDEQKKQMRQEQWRYRKDSAALQHARDEAETLAAQFEDLRSERGQIQADLRQILQKVKAVSAELRR